MMLYLLFSFLQKYNESILNTTFAAVCKTVFSRIFLHATLKIWCRDLANIS
jgi:hypothetical protein